MLLCRRAITLQKAFVSSLKLHLTEAQQKSCEDYLGRVKLPYSIIINPTSENEVCKTFKFIF